MHLSEIQLFALDDQLCLESINNVFNTGSIVVVKVKTDLFATQRDFFSSLLTSEEVNAAHCMERAAAATRFIIHRGMLRFLIAQLINGVPRDIVFHHGEFGKPSLRDYQGFSFNLSHSASWALYAFAHGVSVGIDIEEIDNSYPCRQVAPLFFSPDELKMFYAGNAPEQRALFSRLWTMKEAVSKCLGRGMSMNFTQINFGTRAFDNTIFYNNIVVHNLSRHHKYDAALAIGRTQEQSGTSQSRESYGTSKRLESALS